ncbi:MAG: OmpA family protein [Saprospiraceae bacterium]|nr:OmpA family protein [Saprospiraceae bacterium]
MKNHILIATLLLFCGFAAIGQPLNRPTYAMMIETAEEQMEKKDYYRALEWYEKAYEESKDLELVITIADLSYMLRDYVKADRWYSRALKPTKKNKKVAEYAEKRFEYARSLKMQGKYDEAIVEFNKYLETVTDPVRKELTESELIGCEFGKVTKAVDGLSITHGGREINGKNSEYSPFLSADNKEIYFAALVGDDIIEVNDKPKAEDGKGTDGAPKDDKAKIDLGLDKKGDDGGGEPFSKIYKSTKGDKGWGKPAALDEAVNRVDFFNVNNSLSPDGKRMFFCREIMDGHILKEAKIFMSEGKDGSWGAANEVKGVNGDFIAKSPCVGELFGKEVLFFVSSMEGGQGGYDIYYATYKGAGQYGDPINLGPKINTVGDEDTPFYRDGTLYFSSTGHPGIGGYDIFMSTWNGTMWSKPANMGKGYNSSVDDLYFMLDKEGYTGVLASNRPSEGSRSVHSKTCCNDIYNVLLKKIEANVVASAFDTETKELLTNVTFELVEMQGETPKVLDTKTNDKIEGVLELDRNYLIIASAENYSNDTVRFTTLGLFDSKTYTEKLNLKPGRITKKIVRNEPFVLENILYDFNDDKILPPAEGDLQVIYDLMAKYPDMVIELSSHTDARGTDQSNNSLSQRRAESARRWLMAKGVTRARIEAKGYGETQPKTVDAKANKKYPYLKVGDVLTEEYINALLPDSVKFEAAHQLNRRTEFKILSGPTSITIEEEQLIQIGNRKVDPNAPKVDPKKDPKQNAPNNNRKPAPNRNNRSGGNSPGGGDSVRTAPIKLPAEQKKDSIIIDKLSSLYGKKDLKGLPVIKFDTRMYDMGKLKKGEVREYTFNFTNIGDTAADIDIISVCECTSYEMGPSLIQPGGKGWVKVIFDSNKKDESDTSDVDIFLKNIDPEFDAPIMERVKFKYELVP